MYYLAIKCLKDNKVLYLYPSRKHDVIFGYKLTTDSFSKKPFVSLWDVKYIVNVLRKHKNKLNKYVDKVMNYEIDETETYWDITLLRGFGKL